MIPTSRNAGFFSEAGRFAGAGAFNTLLTLGLYQLFLFAMTPEQAYALAWGIGFLFVVTFYPRAVFKNVRRGWGSHLTAAAVYLVSFALGWLVLKLLVELTDAPRIAVIATVAVTSLFSFAAMRLLLRPA